MISTYLITALLVLLIGTYLYLVKGTRSVIIADTSKKSLEDLPIEIYWQRILRMAVLATVMVSCYSLTFIIKSNLSGNVWLISIVVVAAVVLTWGIFGSIWTFFYKRYPAFFATKTIQVRMAEWLFTPLYWLFEPVEVLIKKREQKIVLEDLAYENGEESLDRIDEQMYRNVIGFKDVRIRDCMIPRTEITAVSIDDDVEDLRQAFITSGHSKVVVYRESIDDVAGYCHALAMFRKPKQIASIVTPILIVPEAMPANDLMLRFLEERKSLALVVDEFGGTSGLVSVEDIVEQVFGEIQDEYDVTEDWIERKLDENTYLLSARHEVDYLNQHYGWELPEGEYDTLAGLLIHLNGDFPQVNDEISVGDYHFTVVSMNDMRIELIKVQICKVEE